MITLHCVICGQEHTELDISHAAVEAWRNSTVLVQDAFPDLTDDQREMLVSGVGPKCWDELFKGEEE